MARVYGNASIGTPVKVLCDLVKVSAIPGFRPNPSLSEDQERALNDILPRLKADSKDGRAILVLAGAAGTGKTTLMRVVIEELNNAGITTYLAAPTGKAASRLRQTTGLKTSTVHSLLYASPTTVGQCPKCLEFSEDLALPPKTMRKLQRTEHICIKCGAKFPLGTEFETKLGFAASDDPEKKKLTKAVVIIDEASMVDEKLAKDISDLLSPTWHVLYVGDREQLPPVGGKWGVNFKEPTAVLDKVHRQAAGSPIIDLATRLRSRQNENDPFGLSPQLRGHPALKILKNRPAADPAEWLAHQRAKKKDATLLCLSNATRFKMNELVRRYRGLEEISRKTGLPVVQSDRLCVMSNNHAQGLMNGEVFIVSQSRPASEALCNALDEDLLWVAFWPNPEFYLIPVRALYEPKFNFEEFKAIFRDATSTWFKYQRIIRGMTGEDDDVDLYGEDSDTIFEAKEYILPIVEKYDDMNALRKVKPTTLAGHPVDLEQIQLIERAFAKTDALPPNAVLFTNFGEALTCHKSQGSQWKNVGIIVEGMFWRNWRDPANKGDARRWLYTAVTRAAETLTIWV